MRVIAYAKHIANFLTDCQPFSTLVPCTMPTFIQSVLHENINVLTYDMYEMCSNSLLPNYNGNINCYHRK